MDFARIKKFVTERGDRLIMVEDGQPALVVMSLPEYEKIVGIRSARNGKAPVEESLDLPEHAADNWEFNSAPETELVADESPISKAAGRRAEEVRLEDLPL